MLLDIHHLFISWIPKNQDIKNSKIGLSIMLGIRSSFLAKNLQKEISFLEKGIFCHEFFSS
jgi:hypothetical protein